MSDAPRPSLAGMTFTERLRALGMVSDKPTASTTNGTVVTIRPSEGDTAYGLTALAGLCDEVLQAEITGGRDNAFNQACLRAGHFIRDGKLTRTTAEAELRSVGLAVSDGHDFTEYKVTEKLARVIDEGIADSYTINYGPEPEPPPALSDFTPALAENTGSPPEPPDAEQPDSSADRERALAEWHERAVRRALLDLRVKHEATLAHRAELAAKSFREPPYRPTLTAELLMPDEPVQYAIDELLPVGGNALLAAQYKTGKTTVVGDYARAFADSVPFLGRFTVNPAPGRLAIWNYELSDSQYRRWLRDLGIGNTDAIVVLHLRGYRLPITAPTVEDWIVRWLSEHEVTAWVPDPFARAAVGTDENSNTDVGVWLDTLDVIKERAGVRDLVLPTHTGRAEQEQGQERARGATRLDDWADVRWLLTKDDDDNRFFRATGRDVEVEEGMLTYNAENRSLNYGGGDRKWVRNRALSQAVLDFINANPGCGVKAIQQGVKGGKEHVDAARADLVYRHKVRAEDGPRGAIYHYGNEEKA
jgi:hypothetical protein